jgi:hypothetical protein
MLVCASCNRAKSWSCEHCDNWKSGKVIPICQSCYWATPRTYSHIAMMDERRLDLVWRGREVGDYDQIAQNADDASQAIPEFVKRALRNHIRPKRKPRNR